MHAGHGALDRADPPIEPAGPAYAATIANVGGAVASLTILMPVFNERATVLAAIEDALGADLPVDDRELVVIDDGSTDGTRELLAATDLPSNVHLHLHEVNRGKGAAIRTGLTHARGDLTCILDADLEYKAADLAHLLEPLLAGEARVVYGTRMWSSHAAYSFWYVVGNKFVTFTTNLLYNCWISDLMTCHKAMETELFRSLRLRSRGFAIEAEVTARVLRSGARIYEVPIAYRARAREAGKKLTPFDGVRVLWTLARCRVS
jgi:glycosyltransferase involved in cell wall biosynthesis